MANKINEIVDVQISRETTVIDQASFNTAIFFSPTVPFAEQSRDYTSPTALIEDGFKASDPAYKAASSYFAQSPRPSKLTVGSAGVEDHDLVLVEDDIVNSKDYEVTIKLADGTLKSYTETAGASAEDDKAAEIEILMTAFETAINADTDVNAVVTATATGTGATASVAITAAVSYYVSSDEVTVEYTFSGTWAAVYASQVAYNNSFYVVSAWDHSETTVLALGAVIESETKLYGYSTQGAEALVAKVEPAVTGDVLGKMEDLGYERSFGVYNADADNAYIELALAGKKLTSVPGSSTWMYTELRGVVADGLSTSESSIIRAKNGNVYENIAGVTMLREGTVASGEFIDVMHGSDDLHSRIQTEVFRKLVVTANGGSKVSLTDTGVAELTAIVEAEIRRSIANDFIVDSVVTENNGQQVIIPGYEITADPVSSLPANQRAQRQAPDIRFQAVLAGAIHKVIIRGSLTV
jgi:hypothetical protein